MGEWLPEPLPQSGLWRSTAAGPADDPAERVTLDESVSMALLVVLESMTPAERVAFVLHDVFRYTFAEVAEVVGRTPEAARQLASSARKHVRSARRAGADAAEHAAVVRSFKAAWERGDVDALVRLLDPDVVAIGDGGGLASALPRPIRGADRVGRVLTKFFERAEVNSLEEADVNGEPGLVVRLDGELGAVVALRLSSGRIDRVWAMRNPEKLKAWI